MQWKKNIYNLLLLEKVTPSFDVAALALVDLEVELLQHQIQSGDFNPTEEDHVSSLQDSQHNHEHWYVGQVLQLQGVPQLSIHLGLVVFSK